MASGKISESSVCLDISNFYKTVNPAFADLLQRDERLLFLMGGAGSGKSFFAAQKIILRMITERGHFMAAFRKVRRTCKHSVYAQLKAVIRSLGITALFSENKSDLLLTFKPNRSQIICLGLDDPEKIKSIAGEQGGNLTSAWIEEATELTPEDFQQINLRLRGDSEWVKQIILTFNPISKLHWLKKDVYDRHKVKEHGERAQMSDGAFFHRSTYGDNLFLDDEYKRVLDDLVKFDSEMHRVYALGQWGEIRGRIYHAFNSDVHVVSALDDALPRYNPAFILGATWDFNLDPMTCTLYQFDLRDRKNKRFWFVDEIVRQRSNTQEMSDLLVDWINANVRKGDQQRAFEMHITGDASGKYGHTSSKQSDYEIIKDTLQRNNIKIHSRVPRNNPGRTDRFNRVNQFLAGMRDTTVRFSERCENAIKDYSIRVPKVGSNLPDDHYERANGIGHSADNCDYALYEYLYDRWTYS